MIFSEFNKTFPARRSRDSELPKPWKYAARNCGKNILVATDDGVWRENEKSGLEENYSTDEERNKVEEHFGVNGLLALFPVDKYPSTSFGLYGMADNGYEWVKDWYDPDHY